MSYRNILVGVTAGAFISWLYRHMCTKTTSVKAPQAVNSLATPTTPTLDVWVHDYGIAVKLGRFVVFYSLDKHGVGWFTYTQRTLHLPVKAHILWLWE
jgi:hypothetical protein